MTATCPRTWIALCAGVLLLAAPAGISAGQLSGDTAPKLSGAALVKELQKGGYIIYFRHGITATNVTEKDVADVDLGDCSLQRPLSDAGQAQTKEIGMAIKALKIPVGEVYSSPYCRALDTARNIFGKATKSKILHFAIHLRQIDRAKVTQELLDLLGTTPGAGTNVAMVSHTANLQEAVGIWPKPEGVAHIFKPLGDGNFSYIGVMQPEGWLEAVKSASSRGSWVPGLTDLFRTSK